MQRLLAMLTCSAVGCVAPHAFAEPMSFRLSGNGGNCNDCEWVAAQGEIASETPDELREFIAEHGRIYYIMLHSPGGSLTAGIELGEIIREQRAVTMIGKTVQETGEGLEHLETSEAGVCASACAYAFMGGVERYVDPDDLLGVHQFSSADGSALDPGLVQKLAGMALLHTIQMGIDPRVIVAASNIAPEEIFWFDRNDLTLFGLDTSEKRTEPWKLLPYKGGIVFTTVQHPSTRRSVAVTLFCRRSDNAWRVLISEDDPGYESQLDGDPIFQFDGAYRIRPILTLGVDQYEIDAVDIELQRFRDGRLFLSIYLPRRVEAMGDHELKFQPNLAHVFNDLASVSIDLPSDSWFRVAKENCI